MSAILSGSQAASDLTALRTNTPRPGDAGQSAAAVTNSMTAIATYIPAEAVALFLATCTALGNLSQEDVKVQAWITFGVFSLVISPGLFVLAYFSALARDKKPFPKFWEIPWSRLASSVIAFAVWGLCTPSFPLSPTLQRLAVPIALFTAILLPAIDAIYNWIVEPTTTPEAGAIDPLGQPRTVVAGGNGAATQEQTTTVPR